MSAHFDDHVYHRHSHETYSFGLTESGVQAFRCRGTDHASLPGTVLLFNPDDPHDGHSGRNAGFTYRIIHVQPETVASIIGDATGRRPVMPLFTEPLVADPVIRMAVRRAHEQLLKGETALACDEAIASLVLAAVGRATRAAPASAAVSRSRDVAAQVREILEADPVGELRAADLASLAGRSRFAVHRAFQATYNMAPSDYQRQVQLRKARMRLAAGEPIADVAVEAGFADQSHLTRWFRRYFGITPGEYRSAAVR
jgi:AraC-like DNA-binding protein